MKWWPWSRGKPQNLMSVSDPVLAAWFGVGNPNFAGVAVSEASALGISAVWRSVNLISGTLGTLPLRSLQDTDEGRERVKSIFDDPGRVVGIRPYRWKQTSIAHLALHGNIFWAHIRNGGGGLAGLMPIHPLSVAVDWERDPDGNLTGRKVFDTTLVDGTRHRYTEDTMTHVPGLCLDGLRGLSPITVARNSLGTAIAGDRAAAKMFSDGALISGMVTPEEDLEAGEAEKIRADLNRNVAGWENVGQVAVVNRRLRFTPWTMSAEDAQFLESRAFSVEEVARWYGVPPHLLMQTEKQTSWGMGVESQNRGLGRFTLVHYSAPVEEACSALLGPGRLVEFDYVGLERPTPAEEIRLLLEQVRGGLITVNEARKIRNLPPVDGGDSLAEPQGTASPPGADPSQGVPA